MIDTGRVAVAGQHGAVANEAVSAALKHFMQGMKALRQASKATQAVSGALEDNRHDSEHEVDKAAFKAFAAKHKSEIKQRVMETCPNLRHCPREGFNIEAMKMFLESNVTKTSEDGFSGSGHSDMFVDVDQPSPSVSSGSSRKRSLPFDKHAVLRFPLLQALFLKGT